MKWNQGCHVAIAFVVAVAHLMFVAPADAGSSRKLARQDIGRRLPTENIVHISNVNPTLQLQLETFSTRESKNFPRTAVTLIDDEGNVREFTTDKDGQVTIDKIRAGLYGVAAFNDYSHASTVFAFRYREHEIQEDSLFEDDLGRDFAEQPPASARLVMATAIGEKLSPLVTQNLINDPSVPSSAVDLNVVAQRSGLIPFDYRAQLGKGGVLRGQLITVMRPTSRYSALQDTRITVTKNGIPVATATANALGQFQVGGLRPGTHGLVVAGRYGYAAFAFEAIDNESMATDRQPSHQFVSEAMDFDGTILPVALVPPTMIPAILTAIHEHFPELKSPRPPRSSDPRSPSRPPRSSDRRSPSVEIAGGDVAMADIPAEYSAATIAGCSPRNPLRAAGVAAREAPAVRLAAVPNSARWSASLA